MHQAPQSIFVRPLVCGIACWLAVDATSAAELIFREKRHGGLREVNATTEDGNTPRQLSAPRAPTQFNPDPAGAATPAVTAPKARPRLTAPEAPLAPVPQAPVKDLPPPLPGGSPLQVGTLPGGSPLIPDALPPPQPGDLKERPSLFPEDFLYIPRFDNQPIPHRLALPRRGVRSAPEGDHIYKYREYPMGQEGLGLLPLSTPFVNRWAIPFPKWRRYMDPAHETPYGDGRETVRIWHPYETSKLKGDIPIFGQDIFANITLKNFSLFEYRRLPVPSGISAATPNSSEFFGRGEQRLIVNDSSLTIELFKGETTFKPVDWLFRAQIVRNDNWLWVREQNLLDPDPRGVNQASGKNPDTSRITDFAPNGRGTNAIGPTLQPLSKVVTPGDLFNYISPQLRPAGGGKKFVPVDRITNEPKNARPSDATASGRSKNKGHEKDFAGTRNTYRHRDWIALQELFFEYHLGDLSENYDFLTSRFGIQPFVSDFRGFIYSDTNLGIRIFGNWDNNRTQYNLAFFHQREKDTYSGLNTWDSREQQVLIANLYRQDFIWPGYTTQFSLHLNFDDGQVHYDKNDFLVRPAQLGNFTERREHDVRTLYLGWAGDGHIGRLNISHAFYWVLGEDEFNGLAGQRLDVSAQMAALELSYDRDWLRFKLTGFWASGDRDPDDDRGTGFDSILDAPFLIGGPFSYYLHQGLNLPGTAVNFKNPDSLLPSLRSSKTEGQSNFVNPGVKIVGFGMDADVTPKLRAFFNANYIWLDHTEPIEKALHTNKISDRLGWDVSLGLKYRPLLTENVIVGAGIGLFFPDEGFRDMYRRSTDQVDGFGPKSREGEADSVLWNALVNVTFTF